MRNYDSTLRKVPEERGSLLEIPLISSEPLTGDRHSHSERWWKRQHVKLAYITVNLTCTSPVSGVGFISKPSFTRNTISLRSNNLVACHAAVRSAFSSFVIVNNAIPHLYPEAKWRGISRDIVHWLSSRIQVKGNILSISISLCLCLSLSLSLSLCLSLSLSLSLFLSVSMKLLCAAEHAAQRHKETWWIRQEIVRLDAEIYKANLITIHVDHSTKYCTDSFKTPKWRKSAEKMCLILRGNYRLSNGVH